MMCRDVRARRDAPTHRSSAGRARPSEGGLGFSAVGACCVASGLDVESCARPCLMAPLALGVLAAAKARNMRVSHMTGLSSRDPGAVSAPRRPRKQDASRNYTLNK